MDMLTFAATIIGEIFIAGAVYGGIRSDLRNVHKRLDSLDQACIRAHDRMDDHLEQGRHK